MKVLSILFGVLLALLPNGAQAARLALVIGIDAYENVPRLEKAVGDAEAMAARLSTLGFTVRKVIDPDRRTLNLAITTFRKSLRPGDEALVHFSGHGVEVDGNNLLLPADIPMPTEGDSDFLRNEAIDLSDLMRRIADSGASTQIFIIDACRDNPFAQAGTRGIGGTRGLVVVPAQKGSFVPYSAGRGQTALDTLGPGDSVSTSVYTRILVESLGQPGLSLSDLAKVVRSRVSALAGQVGHEQQPTYTDELDGDFFFIEPGTSVTTAPPVAAPPPANTDAQDFAAAQAIDTIEAWRAFLQYHPAGYYADLAKAALAKREAEAKPPATTQDLAKAAPGTKTAHPSPPPPAEKLLALYGRLDFYGADIFKGHTTDAVQCAATCLENSQCVAFTFNVNPKIVTGPNCFLKDGLGRLDLYPDAFSGLFFWSDTGPAPVFDVGVIDPKSDVVSDGDIQGNDLGSRPLAGADTVEECRVACLEQQSCKAFSFAKKQKQCWLKDSGTPLIYSSGTVSAVKRWVSMPPNEVISVSE